jgi:subtilisin family serine protease
VVVDSASAETIDRLVAEGFEVIAASPDGQPRRLVRFRIPAGLSVDEAIARVGVVDPASSADRNHYYRPQQDAGRTSTCTADVCTDWSRIGWRPDADRSCVGTITIGVVDTGVNPDHEALDGGRIEVLTLRADGEPPSDRKHGTAVVALLAGQPSSRIPGLVPAARIVAADPFSRVGTDERSDVFALVSAVEAVAAAGARVVNLSLAGPENRVLAAEVRRQLEAGTILVAAVGNAGPRAAPQFPAAYPGVIGVTALDNRDRVWRRAVQGDQVDFAAPGVAVATAASIRGLRPQTGTSFATPFVTAAAAVLVASDPALTPEMVEERLARAAIDLGGPGRDPVFGYGLVQGVGSCEPVATPVPVSAASDG